MGTDAIAVAQQAFSKMPSPEIDSLGEGQVEALYAWGRTLYLRGQLERARALFQLLCLHSPARAKFWFALGATAQLGGLHEPAIRAYAMAALLDHDAPAPHLHAAECCLALGRKADALDALQTAWRLCGHLPPGEPVRDRADALRRALLGPSRQNRRTR